MHSFIFSQIEFGAFHVYTGIKTVAVEEDGLLTYCAVRSYMLLIVSCTMHFYILYYIGKEVFVMDGFAGQMYLGDFGAEIGKGPDFCLNGIGCTGPGGTK